MNIVLLSGGSGKRLWPLSNDIRAKQFLKMFKRPDGQYESMVQRVYRQIQAACPEAKVTVATSKAQVSSLKNQLGDAVHILVEPCRRDTFPAIALATAYLHDAVGLPPEEPVVICPVDPFVDDSYFRAMEELSHLAGAGQANLALMGIAPSYPSAKYGYIIPETAGAVSRVAEFKEKPDEAAAASYIANGGLWNGGVFAYRLGYVLQKSREILGFAEYEALLSHYESLDAISFDYAVVEREKSICVLRYHGQWKDLGTWNTLTEALEEPCIGKARLGAGCANVHVINELDLPVLCLGLRDAVVSASPGGILVADKHQSSYLKPFVDDLCQQIMFAEKSWGSFRVINVEEASMTLNVTLNAGHGMSYHSHAHRDEVWTIVSGTGHAIVDGKKTPVKAGDVLRLTAGCRHTVMAITDLKIIEVQLGKDISVTDKTKHPWPEI